MRKQFTGEVWHEGYFAHRVTSLHDYDAQLSYISQNPARKNLTDHPWVHTTVRGR